MHIDVLEGVIFAKTGSQGKGVEKNTVIRSAFALAPQVDPAHLCNMLYLVFSFCVNFSVP